MDPHGFSGNYPKELTWEFELPKLVHNLDVGCKTHVAMKKVLPALVDGDFPK